jgi:hypothetical protein
MSADGTHPASSNVDAGHSFVLGRMISVKVTAVLC